MGMFDFMSPVGNFDWGSVGTKIGGGSKGIDWAELLQSMAAPAAYAGVSGESPYGGTGGQVYDLSRLLGGMGRNQRPQSGGLPNFELPVGSTGPEQIQSRPQPVPDMMNFMSPTGPTGLEAPARSSAIGNQANLAAMAQAPSAYDQYKTHMAAIPTWKENKPGWKGALGSILAGAGVGALTDARTGAQLGSALINRKQNNAMQDWQQKAGVLGNLTEVESKQRQQDFTQFKDRAKLNMDATKLEAEIADTHSQIIRRNTQNAQTEAQTQKLLDDINNPGVEIQKSNQGDWVAINKKDGSIVQNYGKIDMSAADLAKLRAQENMKSQLAVAGAYGQNASALEDKRTANDIKIEGVRQQGRAQLQDMKPVTSARPTEAQYGRELNNVIAEIAASPELEVMGRKIPTANVLKYVGFDKQGRLVPTEEGQKDPAKLAQARQILDMVVKQKRSGGK